MTKKIFSHFRKK